MAPAIIKYYDNNSIMYKKYFINDKLHREDGPVIILYNEDKTINCERYYINDELHREDGPAIIYHNGNKKFYYIKNKIIEDELQIAVINEGEYVK